MFWNEDGMSAYLELERRLCGCEALCTCRWEERAALEMAQLERVYGWRPDQSTIHD